jgi:hypothetical protein
MLKEIPIPSVLFKALTLYATQIILAELQITLFCKQNILSLPFDFKFILLLEIIT